MATVSMHLFENESTVGAYDKVKFILYVFQTAAILEVCTFQLMTLPVSLV